jgi:hypothetical protein
MKYKVIDNFLDKDIFKNLQSVMLGNNFEWFYNDYVASSQNNNNLNDFQFTHTFFRDNNKSSTFYLIEPILDKIKPNALIRSKANLTTNTKEIFEHGYHIDTKFECNTAVFYINNNNGYTVFKDINEKIESIENRLVIFNSSLEHSGSSCTDVKRRCVINFNFFGGIN